MPKRKATGPAESDGDDDDHGSYSPGGKIPMPFVKFGGGFASSGPSMFGSDVRGSMSEMQQSRSRVQSSGGQVISGETVSAVLSANTEFSKTIRDLNVSFKNAVRAAVKKNPTYSLLPLVRDYMYHSRVHLENSRKGATPLNGVNMPPKDFKSLGEFFDELEKQCFEGTAPSQASSGSFMSGSGMTSTLTSSKSTVSANSPMSSFKSAETGKSLFPATPSLPMASKSSDVKSPSTSKPDMGTATPSFFGVATLPKPNVSTTQTASSPSKTVFASKADPPVSKPAPFAGFSFFTPPTPSSSLSLNPPAAASSTTTDSKNEDEDEEDQPPKVEVVQVKEDDAVYSKRCKVFGVVDGKPKDKGIGMLYVKKLEDGRHQIVVRADNNLGTVILNILLQKSLPLSKSGKNTVTTMDLQANDKKGMPIIIKVKAEEDAVELLAKLKELQQAS